MSDFWRGRRVVVTGGAGFIGSHVVEELVAAGARVRVPLRTPESRTSFLDAVRADVELVHADLEDAASARRALAGAEVAMHLAARVGGIAYNVEHPASIFAANLRPFLNVVEAVRDAGVERLLVTSSACVYPRYCTVPTPESEGFLDRPEPTNEGYGWAKRMEEFVAEAAAREHGIHVRVARPYNGYGPRDNFDPRSSHVIPALVRRVVEREDPLVVWGDGTATRAFLYATDFARGLLRVAEDAPDAAPINIGSDEETSMRGGIL